MRRVCWERDDAPLEVMPLASFVPLDGVCVDGDLVEGIMGKESPPSEWVLGKLQSFKEFVGALYEGYWGSRVCLVFFAS